MPAGLELPDTIEKRDGRWFRRCPSCAKPVSHARRNYCINAHLIDQPCKRCSNISNHPGGMVGHVRVAWYNSFMKSALSRGFNWQITIEDVDCLYVAQNKRCALSGLEIGWSKQLWEHSASIDRIDNERGYMLGNIHLVHKQINMMRGSLDVERFVELCSLVSNRVKW